MEGSRLCNYAVVSQMKGISLRSHYKGGNRMLM
jgi:hypothetical protein